MMTTARMTKHARERCAEMQISTKVAKHIVANAEVRYTTQCNDGNKAMMALWSGEPRYAVVYSDDEDPPLVITVIFNSRDFYERDGATFRVVQQAS